ncbi:MAG: mechanosensitive ion channel domain-containing protein [Candidatus Delongbacteria bacterium]
MDGIREFLSENDNIRRFVDIAILLAGAYLLDLFLKKIVLGIIKKTVSRTKNQWDDKLFEHRVFEKLITLIPAIIIYNFSHLFLSAEDLIKRIIISLIILLFVFFINSLTNAANDIYSTFSFSKDKPIKGYLQIFKLVVFLTAFLIVVSVMMDKSPVLLLSGIGAVTAILLLIFKDTILSLVASVQIRTNELIKIGDWITMPKFDADGDVIDIALHTVKIQNFDKTITNIPTYKFIEESFQNWRGMSESGSRRIKRAVNIDMSSIRFLDQKDIDKYKNIRVLKEYIAKKLTEIAEYNKAFEEPEKNLINQRKLTNIGTFRAYLKNYLLNHPKINKEMILLVRQLPPGPAGLPIEIYVFANDNRWVQYEEIQADIFDHILAVIPQFDLGVHQSTSSSDIRSLKGALK